ncbi:type I restriction enzyme endonuclease domain-containing protein [Cellulomonas sp.]|uniref:type I restriction enzyme endonuclease domain-containing protein n=1 Tax=Cellulomonas sp. TaxID=40001 RepID=UPI00339052D7
MPRPALSDLTPEFLAQAQSAERPHLAIEALRALIEAESRTATRHNLVRRSAFSERLAELHEQVHQLTARRRLRSSPR